LALGHFIDRGGAIHEFFSEDWSFETSIAGRIIEPGHQFEWAWLLERWSRLRRDPRAHAAAKRLFEIGTTAGVDRDRGVAVDQLLDDHSLFKANARLWPQTERIKAWLIFQTSGLDERPLDQEGIFALSGLQQYLSVPLQGLWRDKLGADGRFVDEPAPASSLYHIVCAAAEIQAAMTDPDAQP
jgi:mannose-6-phosphate isomerase